MEIKRILFALVLMAAFGLSACDIIEEPIDPDGQVVTTGKKVLVEDFTGHQCGNCPRAHETADNLKTVFGDDLVVVAVHVGGFARVSPTQGYTTDYTTPMGDVLEQHYGADNAGLPVGLVNRRAFNGNPMVRHASWSSHIATLLSEAPILDIDLVTSYDATTREASITADMNYFQAGNANHMVVAVLTEDSIFSKQSDYSLQPPYISSYCQKHVLRKSITSGTWGIPVKGAAIFVGETVTKTFNTVIDPAWKAEQCHVVVYVMDNTTKEILQVEEAHF